MPPLQKNCMAAIPKRFSNVETKWARPLTFAFNLMEEIFRKITK